MDFKEIQELIRMVNKNNIAELSIENQDFRIKIKTALSATTMVQTPMIMQQPQQYMPQQMAQQNQVLASEKQNGSDAVETKSDGLLNTENLITIKSPIVGTFYRSAGPDKDVFVKVGDEIAIGSVLCIIEAMKLFNEIESEFTGKIVKILIDDKSPVEYDQPLFLIETK